MTVGFHAAHWAVGVTGLKSGSMWVLTRAALSCIDATGKLKWRNERLASECRITVRSLESHLPLLSKLELLKHADKGFCLVGWLRSANFPENFSEKESLIKEKEHSLENMDPPPTPVSKKHICRMCIQTHEWPCEDPENCTCGRELACPEARAVLKRVGR